jgi:hypothetical protein
MATLKISRLERYPAEEPTGWAVGFVVTCNNGREFYIDTLIPFTEAKTDEEAVEKAKKQLKNTNTKSS